MGKKPFLFKDQYCILKAICLLELAIKNLVYLMGYTIGMALKWVLVEVVVPKIQLPWTKYHHLS